MQTSPILFSLLAVSLACSSERPQGEAAQGNVIITAHASADGVPIGPAGITNARNIVVEGTISDAFGIASAYYAPSGEAPSPLERSPDGAFTIALTLSQEETVLTITATSVAGESEPTTLTLSFLRDVEPPTIVLPTPGAAARITGEGEMEMQKLSTSFSLSGGQSVPVRDGVAFSKYASTYGHGQPNLPVWRIHLDDNQSIVDATMDFRITKDGVELVPWTPASPSEDADFEVQVSSALSPRIATQSGDYVLHLRATDSAGNSADEASATWTQTILNPPIFIEAGSEAIMGSPGGPRDPRSYVLSENLADITEQEDLIVGSLLVGNPNDTDVLVNLEADLTALASYSFNRSYTSILVGVSPPNGLPCGSGHTIANSGACLTAPNDWFVGPRKQLRETDPHNPDPGFEVRNAGGEVVSLESSFVMPPNTEYFVMATLPAPPSNLPTPLHDFPGAYGPYQSGLTTKRMNRFYRCTFEVVPGICGNDSWDLADDFMAILQVYATWEFSATVLSKASLDSDDAVPFLPAHDEAVAGYSRVLATGSTASAFIHRAPVPTSHDDLVGI